MLRFGDMHMKSAVEYMVCSAKWRRLRDRLPHIKHYTASDLWPITRSILRTVQCVSAAPTSTRTSSRLLTDVDEMSTAFYEVFYYRTLVPGICSKQPHKYDYRHLSVKVYGPFSSSPLTHIKNTPHWYIDHVLKFYAFGISLTSFFRMQFMKARRGNEKSNCW